MTNHLVNEKSSYLLQHVNNPVDWYPWCDKAFKLARERDCPVFLSIGYATCHFCHLMERESFSQEDVAEILNAHFICIKIDKEQLPHIDRIYMDFAKVIMAMQGGWPLNLFLTPDLKPFYATTYVPPETMQGMMGLKEIAIHVATLWEGSEREMLEEEAENLLMIFQAEEEKHHGQMVTKEGLKRAFEAVYDHVDPIFGGLKRDPKFPMGYLYTTFLRQSFLDQDARGAFVAELSLQRLALGGIHDHIGGGFSRYSQDVRWEIPHFEKQLVDQAILLVAYVEAYQMTKKPFYQNIAKEIISYVLDNLTNSSGLFCTGEDAEVKGENGGFYTWELKEVEELLDSEEFYLASHYFHLSEKGNFFGKNILHADVDVEEFARRYHADPVSVEKRLKIILSKLREARKKRDRPIKDTSTILAYNALMLFALVKYGFICKDHTVLELAKEKMELLLNQKILYRSYPHKAIFTDYAYLISALIEFFAIFHESRYLNLAIELCNQVESLFKMPKGGYYLMEKSEDVILRKCEIADGSEPSANSVHAENLLKIYQWTRDSNYRSSAEAIFCLGAEQIAILPEGYGYGLGSLLRYYNKTALLMVLSSKDDEILNAYADLYLPFSSMIVYSDELTKRLPWLQKIEGLNLQVFPGIIYQGKEKILEELWKNRY